MHTHGFLSQLGGELSGGYVARIIPFGLETGTTIFPGALTISSNSNLIRVKSRSSTVLVEERKELTKTPSITKSATRGRICIIKTTSAFKLISPLFTY